MDGYLVRATYMSTKTFNCLGFKIEPCPVWVSKSRPHNPEWNTLAARPEPLARLLVAIALFSLDSSSSVYVYSYVRSVFKTRFNKIAIQGTLVLVLV